jgi:hypothetical protein
VPAILKAAAQSAHVPAILKAAAQSAHVPAILKAAAGPSAVAMRKRFDSEFTRESGSLS